MQAPDATHCQHIKRLLACQEPQRNIFILSEPDINIFCLFVPLYELKCEPEATVLAIWGVKLQQECDRLGTINNLY